MPYNRPYPGGFVDFPSTSTPIDASALNTMDVGIKTANDQFQTVTTAQRAALVPSVGQAVWDSDLKQVMVYMNASGGNAWQPVGNRIVCASTTRPSSPFEGQEIYETDTQKTLVYSGSAWVETSDLDNSGAISDGLYSNIRRIAYTQRTTNYIISSTTVAGATDVFTGGGATGAALTWTAAGSTAYRIEFFCPYVDVATNSGAYVTINLVSGAGTDLGQIHLTGSSNGTQGQTASAFCVYYYTPAAGSTTINVRAIRAVANGALACGAGGSGVNVPMWLAVFGPGLT